MKKKKTAQIQINGNGGCGGITTRQLNDRHPSVNLR